MEHRSILSTIYMAIFDRNDIYVSAYIQLTDAKFLKNCLPSQYSFYMQLCIKADQAMHIHLQV